MIFHGEEARLPGFLLTIVKKNGDHREQDPDGSMMVFESHRMNWLFTSTEIPYSLLPHKLKI